MIEELIQLARDLREANARGEKLGLSEDELAFYDALETNDSAVKVLGDKTLRDIARELVETVQSNVTIDWTLRENVRANIRRLVRRILRKHGYPPDKQEKATQTVLEQAEVLSRRLGGVTTQCAMLSLPTLLRKIRHCTRNRGVLPVPLVPRPLKRRSSAILHYGAPLFPMAPIE